MTEVLKTEVLMTEMLWIRPVVRGRSVRLLHDAPLTAASFQATAGPPVGEKSVGPAAPVP
jgi:hypothetical protein